MKENVATSKIALYYWNGIWMFFLLILCPIAIFSTIAIFKPETENLITLVLIMLPTWFIIYKLFMIIIWSKYLTIGNNGIEHSKGLVKWGRVVKVTAYRGLLPVILIKLKRSRPKKLIGIFPPITGAKNIRTVMNAVEARGIKTKRWLV
jgi:membrane-associated phospholipid phosphatase